MTSYGTTIGIAYAIDGNAHLVSIAQFCVMLDNGSLHHIDEDYFDPTISTDLVQFTYDPICGERIDWKMVEQLVMNRRGIKGDTSHHTGLAGRLTREEILRDYIGKIDERPKNLHIPMGDGEPHPFTVKSDLRTFFDPAKVDPSKIGLSITDRAIPDDVVIPRYSISEDFKEHLDELLSSSVAMENYKKTLAEFGILDKSTEGVVSAVPAIVADE